MYVNMQIKSLITYFKHVKKFEVYNLKKLCV